MFILRGVVKGIELNKPWKMLINGEVKTGVSSKAYIEGDENDFSSPYIAVKLPSDYIGSEKKGDLINWEIEIKQFKGQKVSYTFIKDLKIK